jgi:hypothetical protein
VSAGVDRRGSVGGRGVRVEAPPDELGQLVTVERAGAQIHALELRADAVRVALALALRARVRARVVLDETPAAKRTERRATWAPWADDQVAQLDRCEPRALLLEREGLGLRESPHRVAALRLAGRLGRERGRFALGLLALEQVRERQRRRLDHELKRLTVRDPRGDLRKRVADALRGPGVHDKGIDGSDVEHADVGAVAEHSQPVGIERRQ